MKMWIDDLRPAPEGYAWCKSVDQAKETIIYLETDLEYHWNVYGYKSTRMEVELLDMDHDAGDYAQYGGDYIRLLDWLEETGRNYPIRIHSMNPVGVENMRRIIERNNWREIK